MAEHAAAQGIDLVLLDIGGPVYDDAVYRDALLRAARDIASERGQQIDENEFQQVYDECRQAQQGSLRTSVATHLLRAEDRNELSERAASYWAYPSTALYADVLPTLRRLAPHYRIAVVANQRSIVMDALHRDGVTPYIHIWALSETVGAEKPDPRIFKYALEQADVAAGNAVHVGNRLDTDVRGAQLVGLRTVWVVRGEAPPRPSPQQLAEPDATVRSLTELPEVIQRLSA